jgi:hypothetical protein
MSEVIKPESVNNNKIIELNNQCTDVPSFDPEAAKKAREQRVAEYKAEHPDAVDDINKAFTMAKAGDRYETEATELRAQGKNDDAKIIQKIANTVEEVAGENYDKRNGKRNPQQKAS